MQRILAQPQEYGFEWIDVVAPTKEELQQIAEKYQLHYNSVQDCLQPDHLPKYELIGDTTFIIARMYSPAATEDADTMQELTDKIAIFSTDQFVISIHREAMGFIDQLKIDLLDSGKCRGAFHLVNRIVRSALYTFDAPADKLSKSVHFYEDRTFLKDKTPPILKGMYFLKRKVDLIRRMLILSRDIVEHIDDPTENNPSTRDTRDLYVRLQTIYDGLLDNTNQLLNIYFSLSSQRTNEVMRVLTVFSVFFMPLTFIAGIYGMNFDFMPELKWKLGYPGVMLLMGSVALAIFVWFKRKGWL